jgi:hypothetical protein
MHLLSLITLSYKKAIKLCFYTSFSIIFLFLLSACDPRYDFSEYQGLDFLADHPLDLVDNTLWRPDATDTFIKFRRIDNDTFPAAYSNIHELREGLPQGQDSPIIRLEFCNLVKGGDTHEAGTANPGDNFVKLMLSEDSANNDPVFNYLKQDDINPWLTFSSLAVNRIYFDFTKINAYSETMPYRYGFEYSFSNTTSYYYDTEIWNDNGLVIYSPNADLWETQWYRLPFLLNPEGDTLIQTNLQGAGLPCLFFNSNLNAGQQMQGKLRNLQVVPAEGSYGIRSTINVRSPRRPDLPRGGTWTLSVYIRHDKSAEEIGDGVFPADFFSISLHDASQTMANQAKTWARNVGEHPEGAWIYDPEGWSNWTLVQAKFHGLRNNLDINEGLEVLFTANNLSTGHRSSGSLILANPSLYWSPHNE